MSHILEAVESIPVDPELWPRTGSVSGDRAAIMGHDHEAFLFQGSNNHYDAYFDTQSVEYAQKWAALTEARHRKFVADGLLVMSMFVPNRVTCIPDAFPQPIPRGGTVGWKELQRLLSSDSGVLFSLQNVDTSDANKLGAWLRTDSHWSQSGCLIAVNEILERLALPVLDTQIATDSVKVYGDLSSKWFGQPFSEMRRDLVSPELGSINPEIDFDNAREGVQHFGRYLRWVNVKAKYQVNVTIVGNSFSGPGFSSRELSWWLARLFKSVTFLHSSIIPTDIAEVTSCDVLIFQTVERFLYVVPEDYLILSQIQQYFESA